MKFYFVKPDYLTYLQNIEPLVMNKNSPDYIRRKFLIGVVFEISGINYFAPVSSVKDDQLIDSITLVEYYSNTSYPIFTKEYDTYVISALIRLSYMFPVPDNELERLDTNRLPRDYRNFVQKEYSYCLKHYDEIKVLASSIYNKAINKLDKMENACCSFQLLEEAHNTWIEKYMQARPRL